MKKGYKEEFFLLNRLEGGVFFSKIDSKGEFIVVNIPKIVIS